jgi:predicted transcriptional regulator of viral defense system
MNVEAIRALRARPFFSSRDVAEIFRLARPSARVLCTRYVRRGIFLRLKRDLYVLEEKWEDRSPEELFSLANLLQTPSYVSFLTALSFQGLSTQVPRGIVESASVVRSARYAAGGREFIFYRLQDPLYFGFERKDSAFMATPEKALLDSLYLQSFGKYALDTGSLDTDRFDRRRMRKLMRPYPERTRRLVQTLCGI